MSYEDHLCISAKIFFGFDGGSCLARNYEADRPPTHVRGCPPLPSGRQVRYPSLLGPAYLHVALFDRQVRDGPPLPPLPPPHPLPPSFPPLSFDLHAAGQDDEYDHIIESTDQPGLEWGDTPTAPEPLFLGMSPLRDEDAEDAAEVQALFAGIQASRQLHQSTLIGSSAGAGSSSTAGHADASASTSSTISRTRPRSPEVQHERSVRQRVSSPPPAQDQPAQGQHGVAERGATEVVDGDPPAQSIDQREVHLPLQVFHDDAADFVQYVQANNGFMRGGVYVRSGYGASDRTTPTAARALYESILHLADPTRPIDVALIEEVSITFTPPSSPHALLKRLRVYLGPGLGEGVQRDLMTGLAAVLSAQSQWMEVFDGHRCLRLAHTEASSARAWGMMTAMHIVHNGSLPQCVSPIFVQAVISGVHSVDDADWIAKLDPQRADLLSAWPASLEGYPLCANSAEEDLNAKVAELCVSVFEETVATVNQFDDTIKNLLRPQLVAKLLLGVPPGVAFDSHPNVKAFREGFNIQLENGTGFIDALGIGAKDLLPALSARIVESPADVLGLITYITDYHTPAETIVLSPYETKWKAALCRYLSGIGHLNHEAINAIVSVEDRQAVAGEATFRARAFLRFLTGSDVLPTRSVGSTSRPIKITFTDVRPRSAQARAMQMEPGHLERAAPLSARTCFMAGDAPLSSHVREMLDLGLPEDFSQATPFDVYIHATVALPGAASFNRA